MASCANITCVRIVVHASRDKILLEGDDYGGSDDGDEDEVFALKGMPEDESEDDEDDGEDGAQYEDDEDDDIDDIHYAAAEAAQKEIGRAHV